VYTKLALTPNFNFEFCNCTSLFVTWCYVPNNCFQTQWKTGSWAP